MSSCSESTAMKPARSPEKPSFAQTCNLLSQYLKEKGSFGDLSLGMTCNVEANGTPVVPPPTVNLFPVNDKSDDVCGRNGGNPKNLTSMDLFPQQAGLASRDDSPNKLEPQTAPMTIFYGGQVIVFNDFPANKAKEIMVLASNSSFNPIPFTSTIARSPIESSIGVPPTSKPAHPAQRAVPGADLPIARRASLHRFLEKRKDRITTKAPYQINNSAAAPSMSGDNKSWLGLAAQSP